MALFVSYLALAFICAFQITTGMPPPVRTLDRAKLVVAKIGFKYMKEYYRGETVDERSGPLVPAPTNLATVVTDLQRMAGLNQTGEIDEPTARVMTWPRCGTYDTVQVEMTDIAERTLRKKRYVLSGPRYKWQKIDLSYKIANYPSEKQSGITPEEVDEAVTTAFKLWSDVTPLTFTRVFDDTPGDIIMKFGSRTHTKVSGDPAFDGPGGTLAHAFTPNSGWGTLNGDVHYDDDELFTHKQYYGRNLVYVTAHELGHSLGLDHSNTRGALMWPFILSYTPNYQLPKDDVLGIQQIYGENPNPPAPEPTTPAPTTPAPTGPLYCDLDFDDVAIIRGEMFAFKGRDFWRFSIDGHFIEGGSPIKGLFKGYSSKNLNSIAELWAEGTVRIVKGVTVYEYSGEDLDVVFERPLSDLGIPKSSNCSMHSVSKQLTYYFHKGFVYKYNEVEGTLTDDSPMKIHKFFTGIPRGTRVSAAFTGADGYHYLLVGREYYRVDPDLNRVGDFSNFGQDFLRCPQDV